VSHDCPYLSAASVAIAGAAFDVINATLNVDAADGVAAWGGRRVETTSRGHPRDLGLIRPSTHRKRAEIVNPFRPERIN